MLAPPPTIPLINGPKVLVVDDREQIHSALRLFLAQSGRGQVVGDITQLDQLLGAVLQHQPDLLVLDWRAWRWRNGCRSRCWHWRVSSRLRA